MRRTMMALMGRLRPLALAVAVALPLAACGLESGGSVPLGVGPGSIQPVPGLQGVQLTVGSKDFTEQIILGYIAELALQAAGANVRDFTNIQGSNSARAALTSNQIDLQWEYTGTAWINYLGNTKPIPGAQQQYEAVKKADAANGITWTALAPMDNTYALAVNQENAAALGVKTVSDYAALLASDRSKATTCLETEFAGRPDGFPGLGQAYRFDSTAAPTQILATGAIYQATANATPCVFGEVFATDGRVLGLHLTVLTDDKQYFPRYNAAITLRTSVAQAHPEIAQILAPIAAKLDTATITRLNARADVDGVEQAQVARDWLVEQGYVTNPNA